jgi:hypothetical protein
MLQNITYSQISKWKYQLFPKQNVVIVHKSWNIAASSVAIFSCVL